MNVDVDSVHQLRRIQIDESWRGDTRERSHTGDSLGSTGAVDFLRDINYSQATTLVNDGMDDGRQPDAAKRGCARDVGEHNRIAAESIKQKTQN